MKIISLNIWGGILKDSLLKFLKKYSTQVDFFCFQEVYSSPTPGTNKSGMHFNIYSQIEKSLPNHQGYFFPSYKVGNLGKNDLHVSTGLAIFVKKTISLKKQGDILIYKKRTSIPVIDFQTAPRNLQFITFESNKQHYLLCHFHGIWYPKTKDDTEERLLQSKKIKNFLNRHKVRIILCGDFNLSPNTKSMSILEKDMRNLVKEYKIPTTRNVYYKREEKFADYLLVSPEIPLQSFEVLQDSVSDHLPLFLEIQDKN